MKYLKRIGLFIVFSLFTQNVGAAPNLDLISNLGQDFFRLLSEDVGAAISYRAVQPAEPLKVPGFDISAEVSATELVNADKWLNAIDANDRTTQIILPKIHLTVGLPYSFDIGAFYSSSSNTDISVSGAELKYAILDGSTLVPAVAIRATHTQLDGIDQLYMDTTSADISISKGFAFFTPYAGVGSVWINSKPRAEAAAIGLEDESFQLNKYFVGANIALAIISFAVEGDKTGDATSYSVKLGFRW